MATMTELAELVAILQAQAPDETVQDMIGLELAGLGKNRLVGVVTLSRPAQHNALTLAGWKRLGEVFTELADHTALRAVVVRGAGTKAFSAGADISEFPAQRLTPLDADSYNAAIASALRAAQALPVPVIAMVDGLAVGGGCELAAACDIRIATTRSRFGIPIGRLGVTLGLTETRAVGGALGRANLMYLVATGKLIDADQASSWGFVQQVVAPEALLSEVSALVANIAASSEVTIRSTKVTTLLGPDPTVTDDNATLRAFHEQAYGGADLKEGVAAFLAGRSPEFTTERTSGHGSA
ncbi:enoyl-CoA hydratase/isomerase family protein [Pedococcus aerophilus]|uniref:Enoyl-CoA hydratase/isomerase family protein n=1 Tax=Pedococcus aerophilus TaxID=436356 RepID=A0ABN3UG94_9MICO